MMDVALGVERSVNCVGEPRHAVSAEKSATGLALMVTCLMIVSVHPLLLPTISVTSKMPAAVNMCCGFWAADVLLNPEAGSPKFQFQDVRFPPPLSWVRS